MDVAKTQGDNEVAVVFYTPGKPWLYTTFLVRKGRQWNFQPNDIELPVPGDVVDVHRRATERRTKKEADTARAAAAAAAAARSSSDYDYAYATD